MMSNDIMMDNELIGMDSDISLLMEIQLNKKNYKKVMKLLIPDEFNMNVK